MWRRAFSIKISISVGAECPRVGVDFVAEVGVKRSALRWNAAILCEVVLQGGHNFSEVQSG